MRTTLLSRRPATAAVAVLTAGLLTLTACSDSSEDSPATTDPGETTEVSESTETSEPSGAPESDAAESSTEEIPEGAFAVQARGSGPMGLTTGDSPSEEQEEQIHTIHGRLVVGSGSCFALKEIGARGGDNSPRPLVFPEDTKFSAREEKPTVTLADGDPIEVGDETDFDVVSVPLSDLKGLSDACARGTSKTGLVVVQ